MNIARCLLLAMLFPLADVGSAADLDRAVLPVKAIPTKISVDELRQMDEARIANLLAEPLFDLSPSFELIPVLAESVAWRDRGKTLHISLKHAVFSDGTAVRSDDVIRALSRCVRAADRSLAFTLQNIDGFQPFISGKAKTLLGLERTSDSEMDIHLASPSPLLPDSLTFENCAIIKGPSDLLAGGLGTGPYQLESANATSIVLRKRAQYHSANAGPERVEYRATDDWGNYSRLKDWATLILTEDDPGQTPDYNKIENSDLGGYMLMFNNARGPFSDERLREAVSISADLDLLAKGMGWSKERLQSGLFPFGMRGFQLRNPRRDIVRAKKLLAAAGYSDGKPLTFEIFIAKTKTAAKEAELWPSAFSGVPIRASVAVVPQGEIVDRTKNGDFQALRVIKFPGSVDGHRLLVSFYTGSTYNTPRAHQPRCDALIRDALSIADVDTRYAKYAQADECLMSHHILLPLSTVQPGFVLLRKPWSTTSQNRYYVRPYHVHWWKHDN